jgi:hypothetical protein
LPKGGGLDQRLEQGFVDLSQSQHPQTGAKRVEDANVGGDMAIPQPSEISPRALLGQQLGEQVEGMHRGQECQQVRAPELGWTELPARPPNRSHVAAFVDKIVGDVWIEQFEQLVGAGDRKAVHGPGAYPF